MNKSLLSAIFVSLTITACGGSIVRVVADTVHKTEPTYELSLRIPQIKGINDEAVEKDINDRLQKFSTDQQAQFQKDIANIVLIPGEESKSGLTIDYDVVTVTPSLISMTLEVSPYMAGAAHPNHVSFPFNYDLETKQKIEFKDLFNTNGKYLERLSELSIEQLILESKKKGTYYAAKEQTIKQGAGPKLENFRTFTIANGNLVLTFDPYQVGPYAEGNQTITLSRVQITDVLSNYGRKLLSETEKKA